MKDIEAPVQKISDLFNNNVRMSGRILSMSVLFATVLFGQSPYQPFDLDLELISACSVGSCPILDQAVAARAQWVRIFVPWQKVEPSAPTGVGNPGVNGQKSGQHSYDWGYPDSMITPALNRGLKVYAQIYWTAAYANGNPYPQCDPVASAASGCVVNGQNVGNPQANISLNPAYLEDFAYNLATRYPGVQYFGPMNEPNFSNNYVYANASNGNYLNYFMDYIVGPVRNGIKAANQNNQLVGPDVSLTAGASNGKNSWMLPLNQYFSSSFDVWSVHSYHPDHTAVRDDLDGLFSSIGNSKPIWLSETGFAINGNASNQATQLQGVYVDQNNRNSWWTKIFYHDLQSDSSLPPSADDGLVDQNNVYSARPAFYTFQSLYNH
jgi:hypothetical protein